MKQLKIGKKQVRFGLSKKNRDQIVLVEINLIKSKERHRQ